MTTRSLSTPAKILNILKLLIEKPVSVNKIFETFENEDTCIARETITKYFSTLKAHGAKIKKSKGKYYINYPILNLNLENLKTLAKFQKAVENLGSKQDKQNFSLFQNKIFSLMSTKEIEEYNKIAFDLKDKQEHYLKLSNKYKEKIETLSNFMGQNSTQIKLTFKNKEYTVVPLNFIYTKNCVSILCYNSKTNKNQNFSLDKIEEIKNNYKTSNLTNFSSATTFKISNRLKGAYILKEGETAQESNGSIIITNNKEDKEELLGRLLKYGTNCEILYPKSDREKFVKMVKELKEQL